MVWSVLTPLVHGMAAFTCRKPATLNMTETEMNGLEKESLIREVLLLKEHISTAHKEKSEVEVFAETERKILSETEEKLKADLSQVAQQKDALQKKLAAVASAQQRMDSKLQGELQAAREELNRKSESLEDLKQQRDQLEADYQERVNSIKTIHEASLARMIKRQVCLLQRMFPLLSVTVAQRHLCFVAPCYQSELQARLAMHES